VSVNNDDVAVRKVVMYVPSKRIVFDVLYLLPTQTHLTVTSERESVATLPGSSAGSTNNLVVQMTLSKTSVLLSGGSKSAEFSVLVHRLADPVHAGIATDSLVGRIDKDDLKELEGGVLVDPVGVKDAEIGATATNTFLSDGLKGALELELGNTLVGRFTVGSTLGDLSLATTSADTDTVDDESLLSLRQTRVVRSSKSACGFLKGKVPCIRDDGPCQDGMGGKHGG
jgi:hypothetical protein